MKLKTLFSTATFLFAGFTAIAQSWSLDDCIKTALTNNEQLENSRLDINAATFRIKEAKSALLPTIDIGSQLMYYRDVPSQYAPASAFGGPAGEYQKLTLTMPQTASASLQVTQNLFNQTAMAGVKAAKATQEATVLSERVTREALVFNVTSTYYTIQVMSDNLDRLADNISNLEATTKVDEVLKDNDIVSENVHNRILINLENLRNQYDNQKLSLDQYHTTLKHLMNVDINKPITIAAFDYNDALTDLEYGDIYQRPDLMYQEALLKITRFEKKVVAAGYLPTLTNSFNFGYASYNDEFSPFHQINNDWIQSSYFALSLKIPVFDGFKKHYQLKQKEVSIQRNVNTLSMMKSSATKEVEDAIQAIMTNETLWQSNHKSLQLAERLYSSSQREYESGITSLTDFLNAQSDLSAARTNYSTALLNLKLAELSLRKANGTLLR
ncbi:MAG: TolC family protein [Chryseolinea sp.]